MHYIQERNGGNLGPSLPVGVFSSWQCSGNLNTSLGALQVPIEPLVGHLRHPEFHCIGPHRDTLERMFNADYLLLPWAIEVARKPGGRNFFFDVGASVYGWNCVMGCQRWFIEAYKAHGIEFDRIIGWEMAAQNQSMLWTSDKGYPRAMHPHVTYFNTPVSGAVGDGDNPYTHVLALTRPEDYVVFKLDIDHNELEVALVHQLLASPKLLSLVDEFFWEHHVHGSPLRKTRVSFMGRPNIGWGDHTPSKTAIDGGLADSYRLFTQLRKAGIRAHAWI